MSTAGELCPHCHTRHIGPCQWPYTGVTFQPIYATGWVCPKCGTPYGPNTPECWRCAAPPVVSSTVTGDKP
jgi:hypothetical protein